MKVEHWGNVCTVGHTCIYVVDATPEDFETLRYFGGLHCAFQGYRPTASAYVDVKMEDWPKMHTYLTMRGIAVEFFPGYALHFSMAKWHEWRMYFPEIPPFVKKHGLLRSHVMEVGPIALERR